MRLVRAQSPAAENDRIAHYQSASGLMDFSGPIHGETLTQLRFLARWPFRTTQTYRSFDFGKPRLTKPILEGDLNCSRSELACSSGKWSSRHSL